MLCPVLQKTAAIFTTGAAIAAENAGCLRQRLIAQSPIGRCFCLQESAKLLRIEHVGGDWGADCGNLSISIVSQMLAANWPTLQFCIIRSFARPVEIFGKPGEGSIR
jgi:hypothetical protein